MPPRVRIRARARAQRKAFWEADDHDNGVKFKLKVDCPDEARGRFHAKRSVTIETKKSEHGHLVHRACWRSNMSWALCSGGLWHVWRNMPIEAF